MAYQDDLAIMLRSEGYRGPLGDMLHYKLRDLTGLTGPTNQLLYDYLGSLGFKGTLDDRLHLYLGYLGYVGSVQDRLARAIKARVYLNEEIFSDYGLYLNFTAPIYFVRSRVCDLETELYDYALSIGFEDGPKSDVVDAYFAYLGYTDLNFFTNYNDALADQVLMNEAIEPTTLYMGFTGANPALFIADWTCPFVQPVYEYAVSIGFPEGDVTTVNNTYFEYLGYNPLDSFNTNYQLALADNVLMNPDIEPTTAYFDFTTEAYFKSDIACPTTLYIDFRYGTYAIPGECPV